MTQLLNTLQNLRNKPQKGININGPVTNHRWPKQRNIHTIKTLLNKGAPFQGKIPTIWEPMISCSGFMVNCLIKSPAVAVEDSSFWMTFLRIFPLQ
jgi:hypothetical protein